MLYAIPHQREIWEDAKEHEQHRHIVADVSHISYEKQNQAAAVFEDIFPDVDIVGGKIHVEGIMTDSEFENLYDEAFGLGLEFMEV